MEINATLSAREQNALSRLCTLTRNGMEFPDALYEVSVQFKLNDAATKLVKAAYDTLA